MTLRPAGTTKRARELRQTMTDVEKKLWQLLRAERFLGLKFTRQMPIGPYFADFVCRKRKIIIELDGSHHGEPETMDYDGVRTAFLNRLGYTVLRFPNHEVLRDVDAVARAIEGYIVTVPVIEGPLPSPLPVGEREQV
jgi:very-short-patch-repair endonuclease